MDQPIKSYSNKEKSTEDIHNNENKKIAYFSMEMGIDSKIPTYSGGLGVLAADTIRSCADLKVPIVAVTLLYKKGYFQQKIDSLGKHIPRTGLEKH